MIDNPPAFPTIGSVAHNSDGQTEHGMTLRDHFAGCAVPAIVELLGRDPALQGMTNEVLAQGVANIAGAIADAMLAERMVVRS